MVINGFKPLFRRPCPELTSSERTQQLRSKTVYSGTVNLAKTIAAGNNNRIKTYNGPYEVVNEGGNSTMVASQSYDDLLSITKGKFLLNQLPLNSYTQSYYQKNFGKEEMYVGNYNQFDPSFNFTGNGTTCSNSVLVYDISANGFTGSYENGGFIGVTGPVPNSETNRQIFIDPDHCYYSNTCLKDASYTRFVSPELAGLTGTGAYFAQQIIGADQYRGFAYPMPNFNLTCVQQIPTQSTGPLFCPPPPPPPQPPPPPLPQPAFVGVTDSEISPGYSMNGQSWFKSSSAIFTNGGKGVGYGYNSDGYTPLWVVVGQGTTKSTAWSIDGINWTEGTHVFANGFGFGVSYGYESNGVTPLWVVVGSLGSGSYNLATSSDGKAWTGQNVSNIDFTGVAFGKDIHNQPLWVAVGINNKFAYSSNGTSWTAVATSPIVTASGITYGKTQKRWVMVGQGTTGIYSIAYSSDGINWTQVADSRSKIYNAEAVACGKDINNQPLWVAVGNDNVSTPIFVNSPDGINWTIGPSIFNNSGKGIAYNESLSVWSAVGEYDVNTAAAYTTNPKINWILSASQIKNNLQAVAASNPL